MKGKFNIIILLLVLVSVFSACKKDGEKITMKTDPTAPELTSMPDLTLIRDKGLDTLTFVGTPVDAGFQASATYFLEACVPGNNFANPISILNDIQDAAMKITISDLNGILIKAFPTDVVSTVDFRLRSVLVVDAGTGAPGTGSDLFEYVSQAVSKDVTTYGLPRLDLIGSGLDQKIESPLGNGDYFGYVKLDPGMPFKLLDPDTDITYGASGSSLVADGGTGLVVPGIGYYQLAANTVDLTYAMDAYMIGLVGSATPNGWDSPDQKMDYNSQKGTWDITLDLIAGEIKFRKNDGWAWNLGGTPGTLTQGGDNLPIADAGNYTISLTIVNDLTGSCTIVKNN
ncbi:MAG: hypothetical protein COW63_00980 [Bacteroidetes bacterium CG18_big_fil_WC_8_21_14_2_50_41_14]|nr:MAG: hypothetical protein COW63_00980 [Bacteroidetes bacterium CG18_big_fil_WC_8_21_14_2_50_41_14]PJB59499.1 MAG: hypothetical protein CO098_03060 [Bacteroidetes bacterium CG_4_9_14_3_um_filter_41_19]